MAYSQVTRSLRGEGVRARQAVPQVEPAFCLWDSVNVTRIRYNQGMVKPILVAKNTRDFHLLPQMANRHGLIAGATGTGKTVTLQRLAEGFSGNGVPVFLADVKGDLAGLSQIGGGNNRIAERVQQLRLEDFTFASVPVA